MSASSSKLSPQEIAKRVAARLATAEGKAALEAAGERSRAAANDIAERTQLDPTFLTQRVTY